MNDEQIQKFLDTKKIKHSIESLNVTPAQARNAGVMGSIGGAGGSIAGAALGAGIGAIAHHPAQGAGIGAAAGGALGGGGGTALGLYAGRKRKPVKSALPKPASVTKSFTHPSDDTQHKIAQGGLGVAALADAAGASAAWKESKHAVLPALKGMNAAKKIKTVAGYAKEKAAFPIVAGGIAATAVAEHVMHQQKKNAAPKPITPTQNGISKMNDITSADEVFSKARDHAAGAKLGAKIGGGLGAATGAVHGGLVGMYGGALHTAFRPGMARGKGAAIVGGATLAGAAAGALTHGALGAGAGAAVGGAVGRKEGWDENKHKRNRGKFASKGGVKKNDVSTDVEAVFAKAREDVSKLERETKTGLKVGAGIGAGIGAVRGGLAGARLTHNPAVAASAALGGAITHGAVGGAIGGGIGAIKASSRKAATKAVKEAKGEGVEKNLSTDVEAVFAQAREESIEKGVLNLATAGEKFSGAAEKVKAVATNPLNHATIKSGATFHAENALATARKGANKFNALSTPKKLGVVGGGAAIGGITAGRLSKD
jgi:hypothetical protein